jgi:predicted flap endonuclease-1-like 5' DNA nuclease
MRKAENVNAPSLGGWIIGAAAGLVAFGALMVVGHFGFAPAAALGAVVALLVGLILGMPWGAGSAAPMDQKRSDAVPAAQPAATTVAESVAAPAAFVSTPVMTPAAAPKAKAAAKPKAEAPAAKVVSEKPKAAAKPKAATAPKMEAPAAKAVAAKPKAAPKPKAKPAGPERLKGPRKGRADDLKEIEGIGPAMEKLVNGMGFYHFDQIASWSDADVAMVDAEMKTFKGRISRDKWVAQAKIIVTEGLEAFRERAKTNNY